MIGWNTGVRIDGQRTNDAFRSGSGELRNLYVANASKNIDTAGNIASNGIDPNAFFGTATWGNVSAANVSDAQLTKIALDATFNPTPVGGALLAAAALNSSKTAGLENTNFTGAVGGSNSGWFMGWSRF